jgi:hypothetical protein
MKQAKKRKAAGPNVLFMEHIQDSEEVFLDEHSYLTNGLYPEKLYGKSFISGQGRDKPHKLMERYNTRK